MDSLIEATVLFDFASTLAAVRSVKSNGQERATAAIYPSVEPHLRILHGLGVRMGVIALHGELSRDELEVVLRDAGVMLLFEPELLICDMNVLHAFDTAKVRARQYASSDREPPRILLVSDDAWDRTSAMLAGLLAAPHPALAASVLLGRTPLRYLRVRVPPTIPGDDWRELLRGRALVPLRITREPCGDGAITTLFAIGDAPTAAMLDDLGLWVDRLGEADEPQQSTLYVLRDDASRGDDDARPAGNSMRLFSSPRTARRLLASTADGFVVSIPAGEAVESFHFHGTIHGHAVRLAPSVMLLEDGSVAPAPTAEAIAVAVVELARDAEDGLAESTVAIVAAAELAAPPANALDGNAVAAIVNSILEKDLVRDVNRYSGQEEINPKVTIRSRDVHHPHNQVAVETLVEDLRALLPTLTMAGQAPPSVQTHQFRYKSLKLDNVEMVVPGKDLAGMVVVSAHIDSTGLNRSTYDQTCSRSPGADDDASGIAGVLAIARAVAALMRLGSPHREIRFVFFNAEEPGFYGSVAYVDQLAALKTTIAGAFQLDMIGFDGNDSPVFEIHAGAPGKEEVEKLSCGLARLVVDSAGKVSPTLIPQMFPDANGFDPGAERSDHQSFHAQGIPACWVAEDFFVGPNEVPNDLNPAYHDPRDIRFDGGYAEQVVRAVAGAVWLAATRP